MPKRRRGRIVQTKMSKSTTKKKGKRKSLFFSHVYVLGCLSIVHVSKTSSFTLFSLVKNMSPPSNLERIGTLQCSFCNFWSSQNTKKKISLCILHNFEYKPHCGNAFLFSHWGVHIHGVIFYMEKRFCFAPFLKGGSNVKSIFYVLENMPWVVPR